MLVLAVGALSAVGGVVYALFQHDLKRLLALHSIENVGIIVLGLGACLLLRARGADAWAAFALGAALLHTLNHAVFKALLFLGAGAFERAVGSLELDRLGGLLRRMPWTAGAFLVGRDGDRRTAAAERLRLGVADAAGAAARAGATGASATASPARSHSPRSLRPPRSPSSASSRSSASCCSGRRGRERGRGAEEAPLPMRAALVLPRRRLRRARARARAALRARSSGSRPGRAGAPTAVGLELPGTGSLPTVGIAVVLVALTGALALLRGRRAAAPAPTWACGQLLEPALCWTSAGFTKPLRLVLEAVLRPQREITVRSERRRRAGGLVHAATCRT